MSAADLPVFVFARTEITHYPIFQDIGHIGNGKTSFKANKLEMNYEVISVRDYTTKF